jgi:hypothetical protein
MMRNVNLWLTRLGHVRNMPYIRPGERPKYDSLIRQVAGVFADVPPEKMDGHLNYFITRLLVTLYKPSYFDYNRAQGLLECIKQEFYRRQVVPYEDEKMRQNGDVYHNT